MIALITEWQDAAKGEQKRDDSAAKGGEGSARKTCSRVNTLARPSTETRPYASATVIATSSTTSTGSLHPNWLPFSLSKDDLVEIIELPGHPWFVATQFHPEFTSSPRDGHPLFAGFVKAARHHRNAELPEAASA